MGANRKTQGLITQTSCLLGIETPSWRDLWLLEEAALYAVLMAGLRAHQTCLAIRILVVKTNNTFRKIKTETITMVRGGAGSKIHKRISRSYEAISFLASREARVSFYSHVLRSKG